MLRDKNSAIPDIFANFAGEIQDGTSFANNKPETQPFLRPNYPVDKKPSSFTQQSSILS
jgi:hypothetical protein